MTAITKITTHSTDALNRFLSQYVEKAKINKLMEAFADQVQDLENALFDLIEGRALTTAVGAQLDLLGTLVDQDRGQFDDDFYRILLNVKIGQNTSQANPQKIIDIFQLLTQADSVHFINLGGAGIQLNSSAPILPEDVDFVRTNMERVAAGGVRIDHMVCYDETNFTFAGSNNLVGGGGFDNDTATSPNAGGFATLHKSRVPFAFAGADLFSQGFGGLGDPIAGGKFQPLGGF